jgi:hypothetical protein
MRSVSVLCLLIALCASTSTTAASHSHRRHAVVRTNQSVIAGPASGLAHAPHGHRIPPPRPVPLDGGHNNPYPYWGGM